jgi:hypothetical protein
VNGELLARSLSRRNQNNNSLFHLFRLSGTLIYTVVEFLYRMVQPVYSVLQTLHCTGETTASVFQALILVAALYQTSVKYLNCMPQLFRTMNQLK